VPTSSWDEEKRRNQVLAKESLQKREGGSHKWGMNMNAFLQTGGGKPEEASHQARREWILWTGYLSFLNERLFWLSSQVPFREESTLFL